MMLMQVHVEIKVWLLILMLLYHQIHTVVCKKEEEKIRKFFIDILSYTFRVFCRLGANGGLRNDGI
jgi:hypothetical protein